MNRTKMNRIRRVISVTLVLALAGLGFGMTTAIARAQQRSYRISDRQMQQLLKRIETRADRFSGSLERALDQSRLNSTTREDDVNRLLTDFE